MATLNVDLRYISNVEGSIKNAVNELDRRQSDYEGIIKDVNKISSSTANLSDCNIYLKKKNTQLQGKMDKLNSFKNKVSTFSSNVTAADGRVATYVTDQSNTFYKTVGIKTGWAAGWESFKKGCKTVWKTITDFYEKHKYIIDFVVNLALLAVAVVALIVAIPTGGATLFFAGFALAQSLGDIVTSSVALGYHIVGDDEQAGIWAERGLKDGVQLIGSGADWVLEKLTGVQTDFFRNLTGLAYDITSIASIGYGLFKSGKSLFKNLKKGNFRKVKLGGVKTLLGLNLTPGESKAGYKAITNAVNFIKNGKQAYNLVRVCGCFKNVKTTIGVVNSVFKGTFLTDGVKVVKDIKSMWTTLKSSARDASAGQLGNYVYVLDLFTCAL